MWICNKPPNKHLTSSARGAKIAWDSVCTPKKAGGLGIRRLLGTNQVFGLNLIWLLFSAEGSLWVAWIKTNIIKDKMFWTADFSGQGSWIWRNLMKLRLLAIPFLTCIINSGIQAFFLHDDWTGLGPLIDVVGDLDPRITGIGLESNLAAVCTHGDWRLPRGRHPITLLLRQCIPHRPPPITSNSIDYFLWNHHASDSPGRFSSAKTWKALNPTNYMVQWHKSVWFKSRIPKHAFHMWVMARDRLPTRDKLRRWGLDVPADCLLCSTSMKSKSHIFFHCDYSSRVWESLFAISQLNPPLTFDGIIEWVTRSSESKKVITICQLLFQATCYFIWKKRNARVHLNASKCEAIVVKEIKLLLRARLAGLDNDIRLTSTSTASCSRDSDETYLHVWFRYFQAI